VVSSVLVTYVASHTLPTKVGARTAAAFRFLSFLLPARRGDFLSGRPFAIRPFWIPLQFDPIKTPPGLRPGLLCVHPDLPAIPCCGPNSVLRGGTLD